MKPVTTASFNPSASTRNTASSFPQFTKNASPWVHPLPEKLLNPHVTGSEFKLGHYLGNLSRERQSDVIFIKRTTLATHFKKHPNSITNWLSGLEAKGFIKRLHSINPETGKYDCLKIQILGRNQKENKLEDHRAQYFVPYRGTSQVRTCEEKNTPCTISRVGGTDDYDGKKSAEISVFEEPLLPQPEAKSLRAFFPQNSEESLASMERMIEEGFLTIDTTPEAYFYDPVQERAEELAQRSAPLCARQEPAPQPKLKCGAPASKPFSSQMATLISMGIDPKVKNKLCREVLPKLTEEDFTRVCQEAKLFRSRGQLRNSGGWLYSRLNTVANTQTTPASFRESYAYSAPSPEELAQLQARREARESAELAERQRQKEAAEKILNEQKQKADAWKQMTHAEKADRVLTEKKQWTWLTKEALIRVFEDYEEEGIELYDIKICWDEVARESRKYGSPNQGVVK